MATFTPPIAYDNPPILPFAGGLGNRLFRYFPNRKRYITVFALSDGTFAQDTPNGFDLSGNIVGVTNTNIPYPYDPNNPSASYSTSYYVNYQHTPPVPTSTSVSHNPWITKVYLAPTVITSAEQAALTGAGYGGCIQ